MSDEATVAPEVEIPTPEAPKKEHWKVRAKREREEALAAARALGEAAPEEAVTAPAVGDFLTWSEFCNRVAVDIVTSQFGYTMLTNYTGAEASQVFHQRMALAYKAMVDAHRRGPK